MPVRFTHHKRWLLVHIVLVCALMGILSLGDQTISGRALVAPFMCQRDRPANSEEDTHQTETMEVKTARTEITPYRQPPRPSASALVLPRMVNPPGQAGRQSSSASSRLPSDVHSLVSPLRC